jgi:DNA-directed RNA polymerase specialized sigma24 family protein
MNPKEEALVRDTGCQATGREDPPELDLEKPSQEGALADQRLAERCVAGEVAAWEELYSQCHDPLLASIRSMLGARAADPSLVDEITARVWYALVEEDGAMLTRYDPERGARLITFLRALAKDIACRHFRTERRRRGREAAAGRERTREKSGNHEKSADSMHDFFTTLTPEEETFCHEHLLDTPSNGRGKGHLGNSTTSLWRWSRRVYEKLRRFLDHEG